MASSTSANFGHLIKGLLSVAVPIIIFGATLKIDANRLEVYVDKNTSDIIELEKDNKEIKSTMQDNHEEVIDILHSIQLKLKDKQDRGN